MEKELLALLARRFSVGPKYLAPPGPNAEQWAQAAALALRAPDHCGLRPFRFVVVGDAQRVGAWLGGAAPAQADGKRDTSS